MAATRPCFFAAAYAVALFSAGCYSPACLQSPLPLEPGRKSAGIGLVYVYGGSSLSADFRLGVAPGLDAGIRLGTGDNEVGVKRLVQRVPFLVSVGGGILYATPLPDPDRLDVHRFGAFSYVILGTERVFLGARVTGTAGTYNSLGPVRRRQAGLCPEVFVGAEVGRRWCVLPELAYGRLWLWTIDAGPALSVADRCGHAGLALQYRF